ncbi:MAG: helix-hairpin-helix domain-containing protein, partial [Siphonobacter aquaeclarae]|nr:helix-hairpin-helix domain-containing protein [Siphonobacter aquaeclarae]
MKRIFLLWLLALTCQAQVQPAEDPTALLARLWPDQAESLSEEQAENLYQLYQQPLDLNAAGEEQLASLFLLTPAQIRSFLRYR